VLLSQADLAYATNDFDLALNLASQSQSALTNFIGEANALKEDATQKRNQDFLINVIGSIIGTFAVIVVGGVVWVILKKRYIANEAHVSELPRV
jgi:hypothetical protein